MNPSRSYPTREWQIQDLTPDLSGVKPAPWSPVAFSCHTFVPCARTTCEWCSLPKPSSRSDCWGPARDPVLPIRSVLSTETLSQCEVARQIFWCEVLNCPCHFKLCEKPESRLCTRPHLIQQHACEENQMLPRIQREAGHHLLRVTRRQAARDEPRSTLALWKEPSCSLQRQLHPPLFFEQPGHATARADEEARLG